jgi:Na+-transporting methylmalonyl-CoA/oxaloacetate decarboxylase gamma subunit
MMTTTYSLKWFRASLVIQVILAAYFQAILWFPLGSWNDQPGKRLIALLREGHTLAVLGFALAMLLPLLLFALAFWKRWVWLMALGLFGYGVWAALQIQSWWIPWIFGADQRALSNQKFLQRTYKIFPSSLAHPAPDAMHFVLDLLVFLVVVMIALGLLETRRGPAVEDKP